MINRMIDANTRVLAVANTQLRRNMVFACVSGLLLAVLGCASFGFDDSPLLGGVFTALGGALFFRGVASYTRAARYPTPDKPV